MSSHTAVDPAQIDTHTQWVERMQEGWCYCTTILYVRIYLHSCTTRSIDKNPVLHRMILLHMHKATNIPARWTCTWCLLHILVGHKLRFLQAKVSNFKDTEFSTIFHQVGKYRLVAFSIKGIPFQRHSLQYSSRLVGTKYSRRTSLLLHRVPTHMKLLDHVMPREKGCHTATVHLVLERDTWILLVPTTWYRGRKARQGKANKSTTPRTALVHIHIPSSCMKREVLKTFLALSTSASVTLKHSLLL